MNINNTGTYIGRLSQDPKFYPNADGSESVIINVACRRNFKNGQEYVSDFISFQGYIRKGVKDHGRYGYIHCGDEVGISYSLRSGSTVKKGKKRYYQAPFIESIDIREGKKVREERAAAKAVSK